MNREIKFRAWTGSKMEYNIMLGFLGAFYVQGIDPKDAASMSTANTIYREGTPVMQYTGLEDKNGKEIYEGDIVEGSHNDGDEWATTFIVEFTDGAFRCKDIGERQTTQFDIVEEYWLKRFDCNVIGNIYENPELLNQPN